MAEAHAAVAFSFSVTPEGVNVNLNHEALYAVWDSGVRSWKKKIARARNNFHNGVYPAKPWSLLLVITIVFALSLGGFDPSFGLINKLQNHFPVISSMESHIAYYVSTMLYALVLWLTAILTMRYSLKALLSYQGWMFEGRGKMSFTTKMWFGLIKVLGGKRPLLYSYQGSLPKLPVPGLKDTMERYLRSVRPLLEDEKYNRMVKLVKEFQDGIGNKLQRYLILKSWWAANYVSDWWEEYVYLRGRSPIMVNSNYYGVDAVYIHPSKIQVARAANIVHAILIFRKQIETQKLDPIMINKTVPLCSSQYERQFNTTRIPGIETDRLVHWKDSRHIVVYHRGRYFKVYIHFKGRLLTPCEIEICLQKIIDDDTTPADGEEHLAALTAGDRLPWAKARQTYFCKGINKASLDAIEKAAFILALDEEPQEYDPNDPSKLDNFGRAMLHGKGYDRWFDKSFTLVVASNGRVGFNAEHSWADAPVLARFWEEIFSSDIMMGADAPIMGHVWEITTAEDNLMGYKEDGHTKGEPTMQPPNPIKLQWDLPEECLDVIKSSLNVARALINDVDLHLLVHDAYGKGFMKKCKMSPDAYIQMALQLAYFRDAGRFCLTYEASMTRLFKEGRTETVRSCTVESAAFARSMDDRTKTNKERIALLRHATDTHVLGYKNAMTGNGIDRHLFCLYVVSKYLGIESPFLKEVLSEPWRLSTSQTPHQQTDKLDLHAHPEYISAGGGFGPVADDGYGVSYIVAGENTIFFHISCKKACGETGSRKFGRLISKAMDDMKNLFEE